VKLLEVVGEVAPGRCRGRVEEEMEGRRAWERRRHAGRRRRNVVKLPFVRLVGWRQCAGEEASGRNDHGACRMRVDKPFFVGL
jgi:hypothetical protein